MYSDERQGRRKQTLGYLVQRDDRILFDAILNDLVSGVDSLAWAYKCVCY
jgi:hypothetical protein